MPIASASPCSRTARPWAEAARRRLGCSRSGRSAKGRSGRSPRCPRSCANAMQAAQSIAALAHAGMREVELTCIGPISPRISAGKAKWLTLPAPKKPRNCGFFMGAAGGNPAGVNSVDRHHAGAGGQEADERCVSWPWLRLAALLALLFLAPRKPSRLSFLRPRWLRSSRARRPCRGLRRRSFSRRLKQRCPRRMRR